VTKPSLKQQCKDLKLAQIPGAYLEIAWENPEQYLTDLFGVELQARQISKVRTLIKKAGFPAHKTLEAFDWGPVSLAGETSGFINRIENILAVGAVGTGKTHLATALGIKACSQRKSVRFYRCLDLVNILLEHHRQGRLGTTMAILGKCDLLIIDELGFVPLHRDGAGLLFNVEAQAYEHQSVIVTSNLEFGQWNSVLGDNRLTAALIDRLVHHAHILAFDGESYRLRKALSGLTPGQNEREVLQS
jgi:DNA replication protein DnaC